MIEMNGWQDAYFNLQGASFTATDDEWVDLFDSLWDMLPGEEDREHLSYLNPVVEFLKTREEEGLKNLREEETVLAQMILNNLGVEVSLWKT